MEHTKTPWKTRPSATGSDYLHVENEHGLGVGCFKRAKDAEFAVHAANCHDELVAALEECAAQLASVTGALMRPGSDSAVIYEQAMAALAKAKGGAV